MTGRRVGLLLATLGTMAGAAYACQVYDESLLDSDDSASYAVPPEQWGSGVGWWSDERGSECVSAGVPTVDDRPKSTGGESVAPLYLAIDSMALGSLDREGNGIDDDVPSAWKDLGFDLDGLCTNSESCPSVPLELSCQSRGALVPQDGNQCRDNTFGRLENEAVSLPSLGRKYGLSNEAFNCGLCRGQFNFVIKISDWNATPNDSNVRLDFYPSPGIQREATWECAAGPDRTWRGNGCWTLDDAFAIQAGTTDGDRLVDGELPDAILNDPGAFVRDGYVVGQLPPNALFWFPSDANQPSQINNFPLKMQGGVVAGRLVKDGDTWRMEDGTIAGRAKKDDLIGGFELLGLCSSTAGLDYDTMVTFVGTYADVLANGSNSPEAECDALSVGIGFKARQAAFATTDTFVPAAELPGCPEGDGGVDGGADATADGSVDAGGN